MKKIGVIDKVEYSGPGTKNIIYKVPEIDEYTYVSYLSAVICDIDGITMKKVKPKYNRNEPHFSGDIIEYDEETNTISRIDLFRKLTESEINQINCICQHCMKIANDKTNFDSIIQALSDCQNTTEIKEVLKQFSLKKDSYVEKINAEMILQSIRNQMYMKSQQLNNTSELKR